MDLVIDIETIPTQDESVILELAASVQAPGQYKKPESIEQWMTENKQAETDKLVSKTSFDGALGQILCIGFQMDDREPMCILGDTEKETLAGFKQFIESSLKSHDWPMLKVIGHNVLSFDLRFMYQRYIVNNIEPPPLPYKAKAWDGKVYDTMTEFAGFGNRISLDKLAKALNIGSKGGISGADVWPMYKEGRLDEIHEYCRHDVALTRAIYKRMTFQ